MSLLLGRCQHQAILIKSDLQLSTGESELIISIDVSGERALETYYALFE